MNDSGNPATKPQTLDGSQWVDRYADQMYRFTLIRVKDQDAAEEIVQVALLAAWQSQSSFAGQSSEKSWLFGILKHKIIDYFRDLKKRQTFDLAPEDGSDPFDAAYNQNGLWANPPRNWDQNPEKSVESQQMLDALEKCVDGLSEKFRRVFILREIDGNSAEDICKELDIKPTNFWVMMHRARNQLRQCMENKWFKLT